MINGIDNDDAEACQRLVERSYDKFVTHGQIDKLPRALRQLVLTPQERARARRRGDIQPRVVVQQPKWRRPRGRPRSAASRGLQAARAYLAQKSETSLSQAHFAAIYGVSQVCVSQNVRRLRFGRAKAINAGLHKASGRAAANYGTGTKLAREFLAQPRGYGELSKFAEARGVSITSLWSAVQRVRQSKGVAA
jgi:hypothetical protein